MYLEEDEDDDGWQNARVSLSLKPGICRGASLTRVVVFGGGALVQPCLTLVLLLVDCPGSVFETNLQINLNFSSCSASCVGLSFFLYGGARAVQSTNTTT